MLLFNFLTIYRYAAVGANDSATRATGTCLGHSHSDVRISLTVNLGTDFQHTARTRDDTHSAAFATLGVDYQCPFNFCHNYLIFTSIPLKFNILPLTKILLLTIHFTFSQSLYSPPRRPAIVRVYHRDGPAGKISTRRSRLLAIYRLRHQQSQPASLFTVRPAYSNEWITTPERSLGSNHVVLGGMILPESAMSISCFIDTG